MGNRLSGFASWTPERRREVASRGGKAAHAKGRAYQWTPEQARIAGQKGGRQTQARRRTTLSGTP